MTQTIDEQLSALIDGELPEGQQDLLLRRLEQDPGLRAKLARYGMIGDVLSDPQVHAGALKIADRVREQLGEDRPAATPRARPAFVSAGLPGAGLAAAAALIVALNLGPADRQATQTGVAAIASVAMAPEQGDRRRANVAPDRMTRYLVNHSAYANSASRQFVDSHIVMPAFQRAAWQTTGPGR